MVGLAEASSAIMSQVSEPCCPDKALGEFRKGESFFLDLINGLKLKVASFSSDWALVVPQGLHSTNQSGVKGPMCKNTLVQAPNTGIKGIQQALCFIDWEG